VREGATWSTCIGGSGFFGQAEPHTSSAAWPRDGDGARHRPGRRRRRARSRLRSPPAWRPGHRRRRSWLPLGDASPRYRRADRDYAGRVARGARRPASLGRGVLIPASDRAVEFVARERNRIPPDLYSFEGPSSAHLELTDKASLYRLAAQAGVRAPAVQRLSSRAELDAVAARAAYPSLLKPVLSHQYRDLFGIRRNILVHNPDDLRAAAVPALDAGLEWLVTEFIPGPETPRRGGHDPPGGWLVVTRLHPAQAATVSALLRGGIGDGGGAFAGRDGDGPTAAGCCRIRQHLQLRGQAPRGDR